MIHSKPILVFVRPRARGNVGALARVMSNFNVDELRFVRDPLGADAFTREQSPVDWALACRGEEILARAKTFATLGEALGDVHWAVGTTARRREKDSGYARPFKEFDDLLGDKKLAGKNWALVLGTEDDGLSEDEIALCHVLTTIDTNEASPSMNVAMAAGCLLYHWSLRSAKESPTTRPSAANDLRAPATSGEIEKLSAYILETLKLTEFFKYPDAGAVLARTMRLWQREDDLNRGDILFAFEIIYQLRSKIEGTHKDRNFLK